MPILNMTCHPIQAESVVLGVKLVRNPNPIAIIVDPSNMRGV